MQTDHSNKITISSVSFINSSGEKNELTASPENEVQVASIKTLEDDYKCIICFQVFEYLIRFKRTTSHKCNKAICVTCYKKYVQKHKRCPNDRVNLTGKMHNDLIANPADKAKIQKLVGSFQNDDVTATVSSESKLQAETWGKLLNKQDVVSQLFNRLIHHSLPNANEQDDESVRYNKMALSVLHKKVKQGYAKAICELGLRYLNGNDVAQSNKMAFNLLFIATIQGLEDAENHFATILTTNAQVSLQNHKYVHYINKLAKQGDSYVLLTLGYMSIWQGGTNDYKKAYDYFRQAADKGNAAALYALGIMYQRGMGVEIDIKKVINYYRQAADKGNAPALFALGVMYQREVGVEQDLKKAHDYYRQAANKFRQVAEKGNPRSLCKLGWMYQHGLGVKQDLKKAYGYYRKAADKGHETAAANLKFLLSLDYKNIPIVLWLKKLSAN